jgi:hypothetical protein
MDAPTTFRSRRQRRAVLWGAALLAVAAVVTGTIVLVGNTAESLDAPKSSQPAQLLEKERQVPLDTAARRVAGKFILTAVARKNLVESYALTHPDLRQGLSLQEWKTGNIPVTPYPTAEIDGAAFKIDESYPDRAILEVALLPKEGSAVRPQIFYIGLRKVGQGTAAKWMVDYWVPRGSTPLPDNRAG